MTPHALPQRQLLPLALIPTIALLSCQAAAPHAGQAPQPTAQGTAPVAVQLDQASLRKVGQKIWQNECAGTVAGLTSWNHGESFASLGIGHFIWYPAGQRGPFEESFPPLIQFLAASRAPVPNWLRHDLRQPCPWPDKATFDRSQNDPRLVELRLLLANTVDLQTIFIIRRLERSLPAMQAQAHPAQRARIAQLFSAVSETPHGTYALIDYVNFKGEGTSATERYNGQGWGLLQVLEDMRGEPRGHAAAVEFSQAAKRTLERRIQNSPPARGEARWRQGWMNRCETYARPL
jgi:hypothetical protein